MIKRLGLVICVLTYCLNSSAVFAAAAGGGAGSISGNSVGALLGVGWVDTSSNAVAWGLELRFAVTDKIPLGLYYLSYGSSIQLDHSSDPVYGANISSSAKHYGFTTGYKVGFLPGGELGIRAAYVHTANSATFSKDGGNVVDTSDSASNFAVAPRVATEFAVGKASVGAEIDYFIGLGQNAPKGFFFLIPVRFYY